ncbi:hypothetical protein ACHAXT_003421 [Thalassiosira profunda]
MRRRRDASAPTVNDAALLSLHSAGDDDFDDALEEKSAKLAADALRSIERCWKTCFAAVLADLVVTIVDGDMHSKLFADNNENALSWVDFADVVASFKFVAFGLGLYRLSRSLRRAATGTEGERRRITDKDFHGMLKTMAVMWGISALNHAIIALAMAAALPSHGRGGPFHYFMDDISSSKATSIAGIGLGVSTLGTVAYCRKTADEEDVKDNRRITLRQQKSKANVTFASSRALAYLAYRNQALCVATFVFNATMELLKWAVDSESGAAGRVLSASDVVGPFTVAVALLGMNRCFLRAAVARLRVDGSGKGDALVYRNLFAAQAKFYGMVSVAMKDATIYRLLPFLARPFKPQLMSLLQQIAPTLSGKIGDGLGI